MPTPAEPLQPPRAAPPLEATVAALLGAAGLPADPDELAGFVEAYPVLARGIDALYAIPGCRYASPALIFTATPVFADWS